MGKTNIKSAVLIGVLLLSAPAALAIPAFARKSSFNCAMCHTAFPKLNDFGQRYRDSGYQLPGQEGTEKTVFDTAAPPIALRTTPVVTVYNATQPDLGQGEVKGTTSGFNVAGLDLLAGGLLHKNVSAFFVYTPRLDFPAAYGAVGDVPGPSQLGSLESANVVFSNIVPRAFNVRAGRFEPAYWPISPRRSYFIFQPYEIYDFGGASALPYGENQFGLEATGHFRWGFKYGLGVVNGNGGFADNNVNKDVYLNVLKIFGPGDGQSSGQAVGLFGYYGWQPTTFDSPVVSPWGELNGGANKPVYRLGGDISLNWQTLNLRALYLQGFDDMAFNVAAPTEDYKYSGGFAELDWATLANNKLVASILYNWVTPPSSDEGSTVVSYAGLARYYLGDWKAVNVALHAEYAYRKTGKADAVKENITGAAIDVAF